MVDLEVRIINKMEVKHDESKENNSYLGEVHPYDK